MRLLAEKWLKAYSDANPTKSSYAFCINPKHPGYFFLAFKASKGSPIGTWHVKVMPDGYEMLKSGYPDMRALCNGFKLRFQTEMGKMHRR
jgi:transcription elongation factor SPT6